MFIKIKNNPNYSNEPESFTIIDNVETVHFFRPSAVRISTVEELDKYVSTFNFEGVIFDYDTIQEIKDGKLTIDEKNPYLLNKLNFTRKDGDEQGEDWVFDTVAYLMSDDGKTIEKAPAGGLLSEAINKMLN